ncbi:hypothetical protein O3M35_006586 [Rhynocoris fuscipes]|uniref:Uncharacterized protein n=1 Tax=Rhynocoris fuscipes TaxID=488301 RepID=A0AAW1DGF6_9HEMI
MLRIAAGAFLKSNKNLLISKAGYVKCSDPRVAVVFSGCGVYDGSEIHEAVSILKHLTKNNVTPVAFGPDIAQHDVVNHLKGEVDPSHKRYVRVEAARIVRGNVQNICDLPKNVDCFDAVVFPGGFGVAKTLSDYATKGCECTVIPEVAQVIEEFHRAQKLQAFACISPILAARVLCNVTITFGQNSCDKWPHRAAIDDAKKMGATVELRDWNEVSYDRKNRILSTPAYMYDGKYHEIDEGIGHMINYLVSLIKHGEVKNKEVCPPPDCKLEK